MKTAVYIAIVASAIPAVWSLPQGFVMRQFKVPTCAAEACLAYTDGMFMATNATSGTAPNDLVGLCSVSQEDLIRYVQTVKPCIDGDAGKQACTPGAIYQYKQLLMSVCEMAEYNKTVDWA